MVKNRLTLTNYYVNLHFMLGHSKTLNTSNTYFYSNKVKDITMSNQQETLNNLIIFILSPMPYLWHLVGILRDYTWRVTQTGWLRYSPTFCISINLFKKLGGGEQVCGGAPPPRIMSIFDNKLINVRLNKLTFKRGARDLSINQNNGYTTNGDKLDPMWVTGFVDAEGCFSIIIEITEP